MNNNYWQMTIAELERDSFQPVKKLFHFGTWTFACPVCGQTVGLFRDLKADAVTNGMIYKRDECKNGHVVDWSMIEEADNE